MRAAGTGRTQFIFTEGAASSAPPSPGLPMPRMSPSLTPCPLSPHFRQQGGRLRLRHLLGGGGVRHHAGLQPRGPEGLRLRPPQAGPRQGRARGVRLGRLQRQHQLRDPLRQSLRGRQGEESEGRPGADEPAQQPLREDGECGAAGDTSAPRGLPGSAAGRCSLLRGWWGVAGGGQAMSDRAPTRQHLSAGSSWHQ